MASETQNGLHDVNTSTSTATDDTLNITTNTSLSLSFGLAGGLEVSIVEDSDDVTPSTARTHDTHGSYGTDLSPSTFAVDDNDHTPASTPTSATDIRSGRQSPFGGPWAS